MNCCQLLLQVAYGLWKRQSKANKYVENVPNLVPTIIINGVNLTWLKEVSLSVCGPLSII